MGININVAHLMIKAKQEGVRFDRSLSLGRQWLFAEPRQINRLLPEEVPPLPLQKTTWADGFFAALGAKQLDVLDNSDYEGANIIHDLSQPISPSLHNQYDFVFDGGALEHVFDFPVGIRNCMDACKVGGHVCMLVPANNGCGHGLYQFSPELFFRVFSEENGFSLRCMVLIEKHPLGARWYAAVDPSQIHARVCCVNRHPLFNFVIAQKMADTSGKPLQVFQHDYAQAWSASQSTPEKGKPAIKPVDAKSVLRNLARRLPERWYNGLLAIYSAYIVQRLSNKTFYRRLSPHHSAIFSDKVG